MLAIERPRGSATSPRRRQERRLGFRSSADGAAPAATRTGRRAAELHGKGEATVALLPVDDLGTRRRDRRTA